MNIYLDFAKFSKKEFFRFDFFAGGDAFKVGDLNQDDFD